MKNKIEALEYTIELLQVKLDKLKAVGGPVTQGDPPLKPCPEGQIRNAAGKCVDDVG